MSSDGGAGQHARTLAGPFGGLLELDLGQLDFLPHQRGHVPCDITQEITEGGRFGLRLGGCGRWLRHLAAHS